MKYLSFYSSNQTKTNIRELNNIYIKYEYPVEQGHKSGYYYLIIPKYLVVTTCLENYFLRRIVRENKALKGLSELPDIISKNIPLHIKSSVSEELISYFTIHDEMNIEGFLNFRLPKVKNNIDKTIKVIMAQYIEKISAHEFPPV